MLKTNSKQARENVRNYLNNEINLFLEEREIETSSPASAYFEIVESEKLYQKYNNDFDMFKEWLQGLGGHHMSAEIFLRGSTRGHEAGKVADIIQDLFLETNEEVSKYTTEQAENFFVYIVYRELMKMIEIEKRGKK